MASFTAMNADGRPAARSRSGERRDPTETTPEALSRSERMSIGGTPSSEVHPAGFSADLTARSPEQTQQSRGVMSVKRGREFDATQAGQLGMLAGRDPISPTPSQATAATSTSAEVAIITSYGADNSPSLYQITSPQMDGANVSDSRFASRKRTGPLSQQSRERAALIRKLGACSDCRRRRVACHPNHHNMTWEELAEKFRMPMSPTAYDSNPSTAAGSQASQVSSYHPPDARPPGKREAQEMDIDSSYPPAYRDPQTRTPLPSGPRPDKLPSLPGIETFTDDLRGNTSRIIWTSEHRRYSAVHALLLLWQDDEDFAEISGVTREFAHVFDEYYHYTVQVQTIPSQSASFKSSGRWLSRLLYDFMEDRDQRDVLKVIYYVGHTGLDSNREMVLSSSKIADDASTIRWSGIQQIMEDAVSDTLVIMDAAYFPSHRVVRPRGVFELIAASTSEDRSPAPDRCLFTRALVEQLRVRATQLVHCSAAELHAGVLAQYTKLAQERGPSPWGPASYPTPLHTLMSGNSMLPSISLSPIYPRSPPRRLSSGNEDQAQLNLTIRLQADQFKVESWNEWLRLIPGGVIEIVAEGPFRINNR